MEAGQLHFAAPTTNRFGFRRYEAGATRCTNTHVIAESSVALAVNGKPQRPQATTAAPANGTGGAGTTRGIVRGNGFRTQLRPAFDPESPTVMELGDQFEPLPDATPPLLNFWKRFFQIR